MYCISNEREYGEPVEIQNCREIVRLQFLHRVKATALCHDIESRVFKQSAESVANSIVTQPFEEGVLDFIVEAIHSLFQIICSIFLCDLSQCRCKRSKTRQFKVIGVSQMLCYPFMVFIGDSPEPGSTTTRNKVGIRNIEDIAQPFPRAGIINKRNAFSTLVYPTPHFTVPSLQLCTSGRLRTLCMDQ